ncbi:MAG: hypothetical protein WAM28_04290 [Chlamydiales bacterium]
MSFLSVEKVTYALEALLMFLNISKESQSLPPESAEQIRKRSLELLQKLGAGEVDSLVAAKELNEIVEQMNQSLKAPYPFLMTDSAEEFVKGEIVAFEHYLSQELRAHHLNAHQEASLFNDSLRLWEQVGIDLSAREGISEFNAIIEKLNRLLPEEEHYPTPDEEQY